MHFKTFLPLIALAASVSATLTGDQLVANIDTLTQQSSDANEIAESIGVTNFFRTAPLLQQMVQKFRTILDTGRADLIALRDNPEKKRSLQARQECLEFDDFEGCVEAALEVIENPAAALGGKRSVNAKKRQVATYTALEQQAVCSAFDSFVTEQDAMLKTVQGKHGVLSFTPFNDAVAAALRAMEALVDAYSETVLPLVPDCEQVSRQGKRNLDTTYSEVIQEYSS